MQELPKVSKIVIFNIDNYSLAHLIVGNQFIYIIERMYMMENYVCSVCGYVYGPALGDPENDIDPDTTWEDVPEDWVCPECGVGKDMFEPE